jgi:hypothetical protein
MRQSRRQIRKQKIELLTSLKELILKYGMIFGGYVRDMVYCQQHNNKYAIIPKDIDVFVSTGQKQKLFTKLRELYIIKEVFTDKPLNYYTGDNSLNDTIKITRIKVIKNSRVRVNIDILFADDIRNIEPPFNGNIDFECNGLYIDSKTNCVQLSKYINTGGNTDFHRLKKLLQIFEDIEKKIAVSVNPNKTRIEHMFKKRWHLITNVTTTYKLSYGNCNLNDNCSICQYEFINTDLNIIRTCCNKYIHLECWKEFINQCINDNYENHNCPTCRDYIPETELYSIIFD